jgi:hypothetical protein
VAKLERRKKDLSLLEINTCGEEEKNRFTKKCKKSIKSSDLTLTSKKKEGIRVTRLCEFSPIWRMFTLGSFT